MKKIIKLKNSVCPSNDPDKNDVELDLLVSALTQECQEDLAKKLQSYGSMCLYFGWNAPFKYLMSAKEELLKLSMSEKAALKESDPQKQHVA